MIVNVFILLLTSSSIILDKTGTTDNDLQLSG